MTASELAELAAQIDKLLAENARIWKDIEELLKRVKAAG